MDKKYAIESLVALRRSLGTLGIRTSRLILFGSYANGTQSEDSDIDVVVISDDFKNRGHWERIDILSRAIYEVFKPIEATAYTPEEWALGDTTIYDYAKNGELISA